MRFFHVLCAIIMVYEHLNFFMRESIDLCAFAAVYA